jgi:hypothetical protein
VLPVERAAEALRAYRDWLAAAPDELTSRAMFMRGPDIEAMPPFFRGRTGLALQFCYAGPGEAGRALLAPMLALPGALAAPVVELAPADVFDFFGAPPAPTASRGRAEHLGVLADAAIDALVAHASIEPAPPFMMEVRHLGGAARRVAEREAAYAHRGAEFLVNLHTMAPTAALAASTAPLVAAFAEAVRPHALGTVAPNFLNGDEGAERDRTAYPGERAERLAAIKRRLDPEDLLRFARTPGSRSVPAIA